MGIPCFTSGVLDARVDDSAPPLVLTHRPALRLKWGVFFSSQFRARHSDIYNLIGRCQVAFGASCKWRVFTDCGSFQVSMATRKTTVHCAVATSDEIRKQAWLSAMSGKAMNGPAFLVYLQDLDHDRCFFGTTALRHGT